MFETNSEDALAEEPMPLFNVFELEIVFLEEWNRIP